MLKSMQTDFSGKPENHGERIAVVETTLDHLKQQGEEISKRLVALERKVWTAAGAIAMFEVLLKYLIK